MTAIRRRGGRLVAGTLAAALAVVGLAPAASAAPAAPAAADDRDLASLVDVFVGTEGDFGNDMPAAQAPNGLAKINPRTMPGRNNTGYDYAQSQISGFTHTNLDGVGGSGGGGDILVVPTSGTYTSRPDTSTYAHPFSHDDEVGSPGYYAVGLGNVAGTDGAITAAPGTIEAEVTATTRSGVHRYDFPAGSTPSLVVDLSTNNTSRIASSLDVSSLDDGRVAIAGSFTGHFYNASYTMHYYATTTRPVEGVQTWGDDRELTDATVQDGKDTGAILTFDAAARDDVGLEVTVSPVSAAQAKADQEAELGGLGFDQVHERTRAEWNRTLGKVDVTASVATDPTGELERLFYTHLYRMFAMPMNATSTSGTYRGVDGTVHRAQGFTYYDSWATWDDFRKFSVLAYIDPSLYRDMVQSMVYLFADAEAEGSGGGLGGLTHTVPTVRWERSAVVVADAIAKGYTGLERLDEAYPALERLVGRYSDADRERGYVPGDPGATVQRGYDQWGLSIVADELGLADEAQELREQAALPIENLVKPGAWTAPDGTEVGVLTPRAADGSWQSADHEKFEAAKLYQGTLWQYHWYDAYDMDALVEAMGGTEAARLAMRHMFGEDAAEDDGSGMLHSNANEIDLQAPYLFNYVGEPSLTQKWTRAIYTKPTWNRYIGTGSTSFFPSGGGEFTPPIRTKVYQLDPRGMLATMDNDAGTMSTMFVAAAIGLFPVTAGSSQYQVGSPFFDSAVIGYDDGTTFTVTADGVSEDDFYVRSASLDGAPFDNTWVDYSTLVGGGDLAFRMDDEPSDWGTDTEPPYSMSTVTDGGDEGGYRVAADPATVRAGADGGVDATVTLTLSGGAKLAARPGTELVASGDATVERLPDGVDATVTVSSRKRLTVALSGTASDAARFYVRLRDSALAGGVEASALRGEGISLRSPLRLSVARAERSALADLVDDAVAVRKAHYSSVSFARFTAALERAQGLLADDGSSSVDLRFAVDRLEAAIDGLDITGGGFRVLEGEESEGWSGGELSNEANGSSGNLGGVRSGAWVQYQDMTFDGDARPGYLTVAYATSFGPGEEPSTVVVHGGDVDGPVVATVDLAGTGGWGNYREVTVPLDDARALVDAGVVTFELRAPDGRSWVANVDWFRFGEDPPVQGAPEVTVEAESWTEHSGRGLKNESSTWASGPVTNVGGTADGDWLAYGEVDLGAAPLEQLTVHYVHNSSRCGNGSALEVYLDEFDPAAPGEPFATVPLPTTGTGWSDDGVATIDLPGPVSGTHEVFVRLTTEAYANHPYVANVDGMTFSTPVDVPPVDTTALAEVVAEAEHLEGDGERYGRIDFGVFVRELDAARALLAADDATQELVDDRARRLSLAADQLVPTDDLVPVSVDVATECRGRKPFVQVAVTNTSDERTDVTVAAVGTERVRSGLEPGDTWRTSVPAHGRTLDAGNVTVSAGGGTTTHEYAGRSCR
ncbi:glycoside hydrolase domain-containing protein [Isoptericola cucumis]|uniref:CBM6 domain-containing protein n=1 Tax=Isoptericola cucumis TaxID=1776856 RepID=A0ABQ2BAJ2_9MICO|nr:glycoside hydrolase domain-containing protein [Isoptericola cucumis]GGI09442.1 hypothetical protein GCM10007368_26200 [Isoptericola cucumis]